MFEHVAIDIGSHSVKIIEMSRSGKGAIKKMALKTVPVGCVEDGSIKDEENLSSVIKAGLKEAGISPFGRRAAISLGGSSTIIKKIDVDTSAADDLEELIVHEVEAHLGEDIDDLMYRYLRMSPNAATGGQIPVLIAGVKHDVMYQHINVIKGAGLRIGVVDCDVLAINNMIENCYGMMGALTAQVNIGASLTQISIVQNGVLLFSREIPIGGELYTQRISDGSGMSHGAAESLKIEASNKTGNPDSEVIRVVTEINDQLCSEVKLSIDYFFQSGDAPDYANELSSILLVGGGSKILGLESAMAATFKVRVKVLQPFEKISVPRKYLKGIGATSGHCFSAAIGLGLRHLSDVRKVG